MIGGFGRVATAAAVLAAAAAVAGVPVAEAASGVPDAAASASEPVPGRYVVVLKDAVAPTAAAAEEQALAVTRRRGGQAERVFSSALPGFAVRASAAQARALASDPSVAYVERDARVRLADTQTSPGWGLDRMDQRTLPVDRSYGYASQGSGVSAYILDTGIRTSHTDFGGRARVGFDAVGDGWQGQDCNGHGTHVAGTVGGTRWGVAKSVRLYSVRVLGCDGSGLLSDVIAGIDWVTAHAKRPAVANMSLGSEASAVLDDAVRRSIRAGIVYTVAAGNEDIDACEVSPARTPEAITVGASDRDDRRAPFSNTGPCLDLFAPGVDIASAGYGSTTATAAMSGTSMAAPHAAGAAALYLKAHPYASPATVRGALVGAATSGAVKSAGTGSANRLLFSGGLGYVAPRTYRGSSRLTLTRRAPSATGRTTVTGQVGHPTRDISVEIRVRPWRGTKVRFRLVAPDGSATALGSVHVPGGRSRTVRYTVRKGTKPASGTWRLRVIGSSSWSDRDSVLWWTIRF